MADELTDYFDRKFAAIDKTHKAALDGMRQEVAATAADIARTSSVALAEVPARVEAAFAHGLAHVSAQAAHAEKANQAIVAAAARLDRTTRRLILDQGYVAAIWLGWFIGAAAVATVAFNLMKEPKIEDRWLLCTAAWNDKTQTCKGKIYRVTAEQAGQLTSQK